MSHSLKTQLSRTFLPHLGPAARRSQGDGGAASSACQSAMFGGSLPPHSPHPRTPQRRDPAISSRPAAPHPPALPRALLYASRAVAASANFKMALVVFVIPWSAHRLILQEGILWSCCRYRPPSRPHLTPTHLSPPRSAPLCCCCYGTSNKWVV